MVLATAKGKRWMVRQLDVHITLLSAGVENEVCVMMAPGYEVNDKVTGAPLVIKL